MRSKYLNSLSKDDRVSLEQKLWNIQNGECFICRNKILLGQTEVDIDHVIPLQSSGKDSEDNFALTHSSCNRSKSDANLDIARAIYRLRNLQDVVSKSEHRDSNLGDVLKLEGGSLYSFRYQQSENSITYSFDDINETSTQTAMVFTDRLSGEKTCFIEVPIQYLFHDKEINPRGINSSIVGLVKEFYKGNPQLHTTLARINDGKICIFDGQHKAVAQLLLGAKRLLIRIFLQPNAERLRETNKNAGSTLRQIAFDKGILMQLNNMQYKEKIKLYQSSHKLAEDDFSFSEVQMADFFKGDKIKQFIIDSQKDSIITDPKNQLRPYIDFEGRGKEMPISNSAFNKVFLSALIDPKKILSEPLDSENNPRTLERMQLVNLENIMAKVFYIDKFNQDVGVSKIEQKIVDGKDSEITGAHLTSVRISREEIMSAWVKILIEVIKTYFYQTGNPPKDGDKNLFKIQFSEQLWQNIENFLINLSELPIWKNKSVSFFQGKKNVGYWDTVFETGKAPDGAEVLASPINIIQIVNR